MCFVYDSLKDRLRRAIHLGIWLLVELYIYDSLKDRAHKSHSFRNKTACDVLCIWIIKRLHLHSFGNWTASIALCLWFTKRSDSEESFIWQSHWLCCLFYWKIGLIRVICSWIICYHITELILTVGDHLSRGFGKQYSISLGGEQVNGSQFHSLILKHRNHPSMSTTSFLNVVNDMMACSRGTEEGSFWAPPWAVDNVSWLARVSEWGAGGWVCAGTVLKCRWAETRS